ncbi:MAG: hypothetical protein HXY28_07320 [Hydrogenophilaceae bacterium]|jgi:hypothetical protein|nr:hypothetical protein [Hydrogenophilaceae bacterium]
MTAFKMYKAELRLTKLLKAPGGRLLSEQIAAAEQRLEQVRDSCVAALDERIEALSAAAGRPDGARETYAIASEIYGLAGAFNLEDMTKAAGSLCDLLAACGADEAPRADAPAPPLLPQAIQVHVEAMRTLRRPELSADPQARAALLQGLARVVARVSGPAR